MTVVLIALLATGTVGFVLFALVSSRSDVARHVAALDVSAAQREAKDNEFLKKFLNDADKSRLRGKLIEAGWYRTSVAAYYTRSFIVFGVVTGLALLLMIKMHNISTLTVLLALVAGAVGLLLPGAYRDREIGKRKMAIHRSIPDWLDTIATTVEAGTALNQALGLSLEAIRGPLADELREVLADVRIGRSRSEALTAMAARVRQSDLTATVMAIVQTEKLGGNIAGVLDELAEEARNKRLMRAEEIAAQMPVKMVIPMALFILPALFVVIFGPVIADVMTRPQ
jgi:pilus assembly protein TadC